MMFMLPVCRLCPGVRYCTCQELLNGAVVSSFEIPIGGHCGFFRKVEAGSHEQARSGLKDLAAKHVALNKLIDAQLARLS